MSPYQREFDEMWVTSSEICERLSITRPALCAARKQQKLPEPVLVGAMKLCVWPRSEVEPFLRQWWNDLTNRRMESVQES